MASSGEVTGDSGKFVRLEAREIALFRVGDRVHAVDDMCPHAGASLSGGWLEGRVLTCPWHCWQFDVSSGRCLTAPGCELRVYPAREENGEVQIALARE